MEVPYIVGTNGKKKLTPSRQESILGANKHTYLCQPAQEYSRRRMTNPTVHCSVTILIHHSTEPNHVIYDREKVTYELVPDGGACGQARSEQEREEHDGN